MVHSPCSSPENRRERLFFCNELSAFRFSSFYGNSITQISVFGDLITPEKPAYDYLFLKRYDCKSLSQWNQNFKDGIYLWICAPFLHSSYDRLFDTAEFPKSCNRSELLPNVSTKAQLSLPPCKVACGFW